MSTGDVKGVEFETFDADGEGKSADGGKDVIGVEEIAGIHESRARLYDLLARLFRVEVDPLLLDQLKAMRFPVSTGNALMDEGYRQIACYVSASDAGTITELAVDYVRTFIGHGIDTHAAAYPFESVHTGEKRLLMQGARDDVLAVYRSEGMDKDASWRDGEDHIALELEFMGVMARRCADALRNGDEREAKRLDAVQSAFISDHLVDWVPTLARDMRIFAKTDLYRGLANLVEGYICVDKEFITELIGR